MRPVLTHRLASTLIVGFLCLGAGAAHGQSWLATGTYNGNGNDGRAITGAGFRPDVVFVTGEGNKGTYCRTATMGAGLAKHLGKNEEIIDGHILSLDADGFTVNGTAEANEPSQVYHWVAMRAEPGVLEVGTYQGTAPAVQSVTGLAGQPVGLVVLGEDSDLALLRTGQMAPFTSTPLRGQDPLIDGITALADGGFDVGAADAANRAGATFHFVAWYGHPASVAEGVYLGDGENPRLVDGLPLEPAWVLVRGDGNQDGVHRSAQLDGGATQFFQDRDLVADGIVGLLADGFAVGDRAEVNQEGTTYNWLAFADPPTASDVAVAILGGGAAVDVGDTVTYTVTAENVGSIDLTLVSLTADLPAGLTLVSAVPDVGTWDEPGGSWDLGDLAAGARGELEFRAVVDAGRGGTLIEIGAKLAASTPADSRSSNDSESLELAVTLADVGLSVTATDTLALTGDIVVVGVSVQNSGPDAATGLVVDVAQDPRLEVQFASPGQGSYDIPSGAWGVGTLPAGMGTSLLLAVRVAAGAVGDTLATAATIGAVDQEDQDPADGAAGIGIQVLAEVASADLSLAVVPNDPAPAVGSAVSHTFTLVNAGPGDATGVVVTVDLPGELALTGTVASRGSFPGSGPWTVGSLTAGASATLVLTADVLPAAGGRTLTTSAAVAGDQLDPDNGNDTAGADIDVPVPADTPYVEIVPVAGGTAAVRPGEAARPVLQLAIVNHGAQADTVRQLAVTNLTEGPDWAGQSLLDAEWSALSLVAWNRADPASTVDQDQPDVRFTGGRAVFPGLEWVLAPGDTFDVSVSAGASLAARDAAVLRAGLGAPEDCGVRQAVHLAGATPLTSGHNLVVDGCVASQITLNNVPYSLLSVGSQRNLVLDVHLPANGILVDHLYGLNLVNLGSATVGEDIARMEAWSDDGDGAFSPAADTLLGALIHSGDHWQLTGLHERIPVAGKRVFVTVDIAESARPARNIRMGLPLDHGPAVVVDSGNDGPTDRALENKDSQGISATDRVIVTADALAGGSVHPGDRDVRLLSAVLTNTYAADQVLESLTVTNGTVGTEPAGVPELDGVLRQLVLRLDGDDDGLLDEPAVDPLLGSGAFTGGAATFDGLGLDLPAGAARRVFVVGDVSLTAAAEGDRPALFVAGAADIDIPDAVPVATWPLDSGTDIVVDGLVADQVATGPVPVRALAPADTLALALDLVVPPNGYKSDVLVGLTLVNHGTAAADDLARVRLWEDGGDGVFDGQAGDDTHISDMAWLGGAWSSPVLGRTVGAGGLHLYVSVDVAAAPADSSTVRLAVPLGGLILDSQNSGPLDREIVSGTTLVLSTSPLRSTVVFDTPASTVGQAGVIRMTVSNEGTEPLTGIAPDLQSVVGTAGLAVGAAQPATLDLAVGEEADFAWDFTATAPGEVHVVANAEGSGSAQTFRSAPSPSPGHRVYDPAVQLDCYPVTSLPSSVNKGQTGLVPITLTLANPGGDTVADVELTRLRLHLAATPGGAGIVPDDLIDAITVFEGTNIYAHLDVLPTSGSDVDLVFTSPAVITHREPVTLGVRVDLDLNTTAASFVVSMEDATFVTAADAVGGSAVPVVLATGSFPVRTGEAHLAAPAGTLDVAMAAGGDHASSPGETDVPLATVTVTNAAGDASSSAINVSSLGFVLRDGSGATLTAPLDVLGGITVNSAYQQHFDGTCAVLADSVLFVAFTTQAVIPADASVALEILADLRPDAAPQIVVPVLAAAGFVAGEDANTGDPVPVDTAASVPGPRLEILAPATGITAGGRGLLPPDVAVGTAGLQLLEITLTHPGDAVTAAVAADSLRFLVRDGAGLALDPVTVFDRIRVTAGGVLHADVVDPAGPGGRLALPLSGLMLDPGGTVTLVCAADLAPEPTSSSFQLVLSLDDIVVSDAVTGAAVPTTSSGAAWPLSSGTARVLVPAEELAIGGRSLMPPLLAPGPEAYPVLELAIRNTAAAGDGSIEVHGLTVEQPDLRAGELGLGAVAGTLQILRGETVLGFAAGFDKDAASVAVSITPPLVVPADGTVDLRIALVVADDAPAGAVRVRVGETSLVAGHPGGAPGGIRIVPASGQSLPLESLAGNVGKAGLADSYINFPNPFAAGREATVFAYDLERDAAVTLRVLTPHGEPVATVLDREPRPAGFHQSDAWNGLNGRGVTVRNGVYIAEITVEYDDGSRERHLRKVAVVR